MGIQVPKLPRLNAPPPYLQLRCARPLLVRSSVARPLRSGQPLRFARRPSELHRALPELRRAPPLRPPPLPSSTAPLRSAATSPLRPTLPSGELQPSRAPATSCWWLLMDDLQKSDYPSRRLIILGSITGNSNTLAGNVPPKAGLGDLGGLTGASGSAMIDGADSFDGAKAYKDSKISNMLTMQEFHRRFHEGTGITFASLYLGCIATTGLFREHVPLFRALFPPFQRFVTKGFVTEAESGKRLAQVVAEPSLTKSGVYWSWNKDSASFENHLSQEASDPEKARKLWELSEKLIGLA